MEVFGLYELIRDRGELGTFEDRHQLPDPIIVLKFKNKKPLPRLQSLVIPPICSQCSGASVIPLSVLCLKPPCQWHPSSQPQPWQPSHVFSFMGQDWLGPLKKQDRCDFLKFLQTALLPRFLSLKSLVVLYFIYFLIFIFDSFI